MKSGKHKKRIHYTVMIVSDSLDGGRSYYLKQGLVKAILFLIAAILAAAAGLAVYCGTVLDGVSSREEEMEQQIEQLTEENAQLVTDNTELSDKVAILSETVTKNAESQKEQEQQEEEKRIPKGFPLAGPAVILESSETAETVTTEDAENTEEDEAEDGEDTQDGEDGQETAKEPIVVFSASVGTKVIATASGTVVSVEDNADYGHKITVDHGNGYLSVYMAASDPKASEGDEVEAGAELYEMQIPDERLGYQITKDGTLIDPLELMEVYG